MNDTTSTSTIWGVKANSPPSDVGELALQFRQRAAFPNPEGQMRLRKKPGSGDPHPPRSPELRALLQGNSAPRSAPAEKKLKLGARAGCAAGRWLLGSWGPQGDGHSPTRDPTARMVRSVLIGPGTEPSFGLHSGPGAEGRLGSFAALAGGSTRARGGRGEQGGWDLSSGARVQRCLAWVLQKSRTWVRSQGVPLLVAENSTNDRPACLSSLVADSSQDTWVAQCGS